MGVTHHLTSINGISRVSTSYSVKNLHHSFGVSIKKAGMNLNGTYRVTC